jgi:hypothetical protein
MSIVSATAQAMRARLLAIATTSAAITKLADVNHNRTIHGPLHKAQAHLTRKLREHNLGRDLEGAKI